MKIKPYQTIVALVLIYIAFSFYWDNYVYGIYNNDDPAQISILGPTATDTLYQFETLPEGAIELKFVKRTLTVNLKGGSTAVVHYPDSAQVHIKEYRSSDTVSLILL